MKRRLDSQEIYTNKGEETSIDQRTDGLTKEMKTEEGELTSRRW